MRTYQNPIIPGFYPDPSICRVGEDYYLVNSSFECFPGVPLWHSANLVEWEQLGHVLTRPSQVLLDGSPISGGVFAPCIREHEGTFYMVTTNVNLFSTGAPNFLVSTDDIRGEWSEPVPIYHMGIDPSLFFDEDGTCYYTGTGFDETGRQGIVLFALDVATGEALGEKRFVWYGSGGRNPEGPHLYKRDGWYYLLLAEGGTEYGHMVTISRSRSVWGPYESCPANPILTHRDNSKSVFQGVGHADLVDAPDGSWYLVCHAFRPSQSQLHHIGRETMLASVAWEDGWPVVNDGKSLAAVMEVPGEGTHAAFEVAFEDDFCAPRLAPRYCQIWNPKTEGYEVGNSLFLHGSSVTLDDAGSPTFVGVRQQQMELAAEATLKLEGAGIAGLSVYHNREHHYDLCVRRDGRDALVWLRRRVADMETETAPLRIEHADLLELRVEANRSQYVFLAGIPGNEPVRIGTGSTQLLSTEVMRGTFTGCLFGLFAEGEVVATVCRLAVTESEEQRKLNRADGRVGYNL